VRHFRESGNPSTRQLIETGETLDARFRGHDDQGALFSFSIGRHWFILVRYWYETLVPRQWGLIRSGGEQTSCRQAFSALGYGGKKK
jgi:hypothetical protein